MNLVFLITIVVEDFSNQRTPHQLRVSMFDLKQEWHRRVIRTICLFKTVVTIRMLLNVFFLSFETQTKEVFQKLGRGADSEISTSDQQMFLSAQVWVQLIKEQL